MKEVVFETPEGDKEYYGTKRVTAWIANKIVGATRDDSGKHVPGYAVVYQDGYRSWCPKKVFEAVYQPLDALSFSHALQALKDGYRVARAGWNGKDIWLELVNEDEWSTSIGPSFVENAHLLPWIGMKTADGGFVPWVASQSDMLANDWKVL